MKEVIEVCARALVDDPDSVEVSVVEGEKSVIYQVKVAPDDLGKVIGKQGRIIQALRTIVRAAGVRQGKRAIVEILD